MECFNKPFSVQSIFLSSSLCQCPNEMTNKSNLILQIIMKFDDYSKSQRKNSQHMALGWISSDRKYIVIESRIITTIVCIPKHRYRKRQPPPGKLLICSTKWRRYSSIYSLGELLKIMRTFVARNATKCVISHSLITH